MAERFVDVDLSGARFERVDLSGAVMRSVVVDGAEVEAPWLLDDGASLVVNGVDVAPLVDAELDARMPGRSLRRAGDPDGLRAAWAALEQSWERVLERVAAMPSGTVDVSVDDEWSFAQTLRHLVMATDTWLGRAVLGLDQPYHPLGQPHAEYETDGYDMSVFTTRQPTYEEVLEARAGRQRMVREHLATLVADDLAQVRANPWAPQHAETTLSCLRTILDEEWEHQRYAVRDLDLLEARTASSHAQPTNMQKG